METPNQNAKPFDLDRLVRCCACGGTGKYPNLPNAPKCYTCEGHGKRPTCYQCGTPLYRNSFTDGWFCCGRCEEARTKETHDFLTANDKGMARELAAPDAVTTEKL